MPAPYRKHSYTLRDAAQRHQPAPLVRIWCRYCKTSRYFVIDDLVTVFGNIECDDVVDKHTWRCGKCGDVNIDLKLETPSAEARQKLTLRRLDRIEYVRRVVWRDE